MPFDADAARAALLNISREASQIPALFETAATDPKSEALPVIWDEFDSFTSRASELESLTRGLAGSVTTEADLRLVIQQLGKACGACHSDFRE